MSDGRVRFGVFEFSPETGALTRDGIPVKLQAQPARVLATLIAHAGEVVSRDTLQREVWGTDTHVDFDRGLNFCIAQIRSALKDSSDQPRYVATIPKTGYRFVAPVERVSAPPAADVVTDPPVAAGHAVPPASRTRVLGRYAALALLVAFGIVALTRLPSATPTAPPDTIIVVPFYNETGRPELDRLALNLGDVTVARLAASGRTAAFSVIGNAPSLRNPFARNDVQGVAKSLGANWVVIGQLKSDGQNLRLIGHLIRSGDMKHVWADTIDDPDFSLPAQERAAERIAVAVSQALAKD